MCTFLVTLCCPVADLVALHGKGHSCAAMTLKEKKYVYSLAIFQNPLKSITIIVGFSDMDEPDSLFLLFGDSGKVAYVLAVTLNRLKSSLP